MSTLRPFILSSLALHLLGVGLLCFWIFSPPPALREEIKVLTVMLVGEEPYSGGPAEGRKQKAEGSGGRESADRRSPAKSVGAQFIASPQGPAKVGAQNFEPLQDAASTGALPVIRTEGETPGLSRPTTSLGGGAAGGQRGAAERGTDKITSLPGDGGGLGLAGPGGNGWGRGGGAQLYLKGGYQITPAYPSAARRQGREGTAYLKIRVSPEGRVLEVLIEQSSGHHDLDEAAAEAVKAWRFEPPVRGEQRVGVWARVPVKFQLKK